MPAGGSVTGTFTFAASCSPVSLTVAVDPLNVIAECTESPTAAACRADSGIDSVVINACSCAQAGSPTATPASTCGGATTLSAAGVSLTGCTGTPQYEWRLGAAVLGTGTTISVTPSATTTYELRTTCSNDATCVTTSNVTVPFQGAPVFTTASVTDVSPCGEDLRLDWTAPAYETPTGVVNVYRSTVSCADALTRPRIGVVPAATTYLDTGTTGGSSYFYVVEAEDARAPTACTPQGPNNGGAVTRLCLGPVVDVASPGASGNAIATPSRLCAGSSSTLDATGVTFASCAGGASYQWRNAAGTLLGTSATLSVSPATTATYTLTITCTTDAACTDTRSVTVDVDAPPSFTTAQAQDLSSCGLGIGLTWTGATFVHAPGAYNVYRSTTSCAAAIAAGPIATGVAASPWTDTGTSAATTYFYVVEAEDAAAPSACSPQGPRNGGSVTRLCLAPVTDAADPGASNPPPDQVICAGSSALLDASGLTFSACAGSISYEWREGATILATTPSVTVSPAVTTTYAFTLTCSTDPTCVISDFVTVTVDEAPVFAGGQAVDASACGLGIALSWPAASFASGAGVYNVYRSTTSCADALLAAPAASGLAATAWTDATTAAGVSYFYVIEAEDQRAPSACTPTGPGGGAATRSCVGPVTDAADASGSGAPTATPSRICAGASSSLDASSFAFPTCAGGAAYEWRDGATLIATTATVTVTPAVTTTYDVAATCPADPACGDSRSITVTVDERPVLGAVQATDVSGCVDGIDLAWPAATFPSGSGTYSIYRSTTSCADALTQGAISSGQAATSLSDSSTTAGSVYYYVVLAEDAAGGRSCAPAGPRNGGSTVTSCVGPVTDLVDALTSTPPVDASACVGATTRLDASALGFASCTGALDVTWRVGATIVGNGPAIDVSPSVTTSYEATIACTTGASCVAAVVVDVTVEEPPTFTDVTVIDLAPCNLGLELTWTDAVFHDVTASGSYNVYASTVSCADALARPAVATGLTLTRWPDPGTVAGVDYYYVVEAEDARLATACTRGASHGGAATRACVGPVRDIEDSAGTPSDAGPVLRMRKDAVIDDLVTAFWPGLRPLLPGEHLHLLKAWSDPQSAFTLVNGEAFTAPSYTETDTTTRLQFFDLRVANACEGQSND